jgi:hypothetical protein
LWHTRLGDILLQQGKLISETRVPRRTFRIESDRFRVSDLP